MEPESLPPIRAKSCCVAEAIRLVPVCMAPPCPHGGTLGGRESCINVSELWCGALMLRARRVSAHPTPIKAPRGHNWRPVLRLPSTQFVHPHSQAGFSRSLLKAGQPPSSMK